LLTTILITGGLSAIPYAYSSGPDTLKVKYLGPIADDPAVTTIQIYKKIDDFGSPPLGPEITITNEVGGDEFMVISQNYGKDKLNSNTVFRILVDGEQIDVAEIHTSCSKPLFIGQIVVGQEGLVTLEVLDGTLGGDENSILPNTVDEKCIDNKDSKNTATIILKKAITNDNGGTITDPAEFLPKIDGEDVLFGEPIPITAKEPHTISESVLLGYSFVLIAGDTECPSMLDEEFTVKKNKEITCTIYNDDNGDVQTVQPDGPGVIFHQDTLTMVLDPLAPVGQCDGGETLPCWDFIGSRVAIVPDIEPEDSQQLTDTTLILLTVLDITNPATNLGCQITGLGTLADQPAFIMICLLDPGNISDTYHANFGLVETG
jgi:hypothetical protein